MSRGNAFCAKCGAGLQPDSAYCPKCGAAVNALASVPGGTTATGPTNQQLSWRDQRRLLKLQRKAAKHGLTLTAPSTTTTIVQKEVVKIPCKFCGALVPITGEVTKCPSCGAPLKV